MIQTFTAQSGRLDKLETRKTKQHEILKPNIASAGTIPNGATEIGNGRVRKRLQHDADHLSSQRKKRCGRGLSYSPRKGPEKSRKELRNPYPMACRKKC